MTWGVTTSKPEKQQVTTVAGQVPDAVAREKVEQQKTFASKKAYICAGMMLVCGLLTILGGICQEFAVYRLWGKFYGWSIWTGVLFSIAGTCAVLASKKQSKPRLVSATVFSILAVITALVVIIFFGFCVAKGVKMHHRRMAVKERHLLREEFGKHFDKPGEYEHRYDWKLHHGDKPHHVHHRIGLMNESGEYEHGHGGKPHGEKPHHGEKHHEHHHHGPCTKRPGPRPTGHPRPRPTGHPWPRPTGHPWPRPTGHHWPRPTGHPRPRPRPTGHPWPRPTGHHWPRPTGHSRPTGHPKPRPTGHPWPRPTGHHWPRPTGHHWPRPTGHHWPKPTRRPLPNGPRPQQMDGGSKKDCKFTRHGWASVMLIVASLAVVTLVLIELVNAIILTVFGVRSLKAAKYLFVPANAYKTLANIDHLPKV